MGTGSLVGCAVLPRNVVIDRGRGLLLRLTLNPAAVVDTCLGRGGSSLATSASMQLPVSTTGQDELLPPPAAEAADNEGDSALVLRWLLNRRPHFFPEADLTSLSRTVLREALAARVSMQTAGELFAAIAAASAPSRAGRSSPHQYTCGMQLLDSQEPEASLAWLAGQPGIDAVYLQGVISECEYAFCTSGGQPCGTPGGVTAVATSTLLRHRREHPVVQQFRTRFTASSAAERRQLGFSADPTTLAQDSSTMPGTTHSQNGSQRAALGVIAEAYRDGAFPEGAELACDLLLQSSSPAEAVAMLNTMGMTNRAAMLAARTQ